MAVGLGYASYERIDEINILQATYEAMREAISKLAVQPDILLNDAVTIPKGNNTAGANHQGRCQERFHCCSKYRGKGHKRPDDGKI